MNCRLVMVTQNFKQNITDFLFELGDGENGYMGSHFAKGQLSIDEQLMQYVNMSKGIGLEDWQIPMTTYWLLDDNDTIIGMSRLRHTLTDMLLVSGGHIGYYISPKLRKMGLGKEILRLTLIEASKMNIKKALLTIDSGNISSLKIVESNNGILEDERKDDEGNQYRRYWISLDNIKL